MPEAWFNNYYNAACEIEQGYKGCINYTVMWEEYTGGAHPNSFYTVLNFNPETGEEMVLSDIFKKENFEEALTAKLIENLARQLQVVLLPKLASKVYTKLELQTITNTQPYSFSLTISPFKLRFIQDMVIS
jgi:hypothetical protein